MADNFFEVQAETEQESLLRAAEGYVKPTTLQGVIGGMKSGFRTGITAMGIDKTVSVVAPLFSESAGKMLTAAEANNIFEPVKPFTEDINMIDASIRRSRERTLMEQQELVSGAELGGFASIASNFAGAMADPLTILGGSLLSKGLTTINAGIAVKATRILGATATGKTAAILGSEILENVIFAAGIDIPLGEGLENIYGEEITIADHAFNIIAGTMAGTALRGVGHILASKASRNMNTLDGDTLKKVLTEESINAQRANRAPNFERASAKFLQDIGEYASDPSNLKNAYSITGDIGDSPTSFFSTHKANFDSISDSAVGVGRTFGSGMHMVNNTALALAKAFHVEKGQLLKFDSTDFKLVDIEQVFSNDSVMTKVVREVLGEHLDSKTIDNLLKDPKTFKDMLDEIEIRTADKGDSVLDEINNKLLKEEGIEGYTYREDLGGEEGSTHQVGDVTFVFKDVDVLPRAKSGALSFETEGLKNAWNKSKAATKLANETPKIVEFEGDKIYNNKFTKNNPEMYAKDEAIVRAYNDTYSPEAVEAMKFTVDAELDIVIKDAQEAMEEFKASIKSMEETGRDISQFKVATENIDATLKEIELADEAVKAATVCVRR